MQFTKLVAILATTVLAASASAQDSQAGSGVVILNNNTNSNSSAASNDNQSLSGSRGSQTQTATQQPTTIVEANPVSESRAEAMRKARQNAEQNTESKIVEKLEEARLKEEQDRAERMFGNKIESTSAATATAIATPTGAAATATAVTTTSEVPKEEKATNVTIEKVEIVQPAIVQPVKPIVEEEAPVNESKISIVEEKKEERKERFYVTGLLAAPTYNASNIQSNWGLGFGLGVITDKNLGLEGTFMYSNHSVDTYWKDPVYANLDQYDITASAKYYVLPTALKPFVGGSLSYIYRSYSDRVKNSQAWLIDKTEEESTHAVNMGLQAGVDFEVNEKFIIGAGIDWNFNLMRSSDVTYPTLANSNATPLEEVDYYTLKLGAKLSF